MPEVSTADAEVLPSEIGWLFTIRQARVFEKAFVRARPPRQPSREAQSSGSALEGAVSHAEIGRNPRRSRFQLKFGGKEVQQILQRQDSGKAAVVNHHQSAVLSFLHLGKSLDGIRVSSHRVFGAGGAHYSLHAVL